ncbi:aldehyde dehydrogenase family protein [Pseudoruegeria sp. HB172150]|uniref:aldehyde dehydrogenase family protein n=1 Tax=Pseudoruegeria sp. HB172150 TaxID=2721164 RepID=UPI0015554A98|nr:aldehyde dehydrogenase family protein [Pseudoruegeria sp. HB172150]
MSGNSSVDVTFDIENPRMLIGGELVESASGRRYDCVNPADETLLAQVPEGSAEDVAAAVGAAQDAQPAWAAAGVAARAETIRRFAYAILEHGERLLQVEVKDSGNIISEMRRDVASSARQLNYYAALGYEMKGSTIPATPGNLHFTEREPYGVVGRIVPFNHPLMFAAAKLGAPLITGNTVVLKPSEQSPLSACYLGELAREIFPPGVVNVVTGFGKEAGEALVRHPEVKRLAFIGSVATGLHIQRSAAEVAVKQITLELGGKNPLIVFPDADMKKAIPGAIKGMNFGWQGQSCGSTSRLFLHDDIHDEFLAAMVERLSAMKIGDPLDEMSQIGPMISAAQIEKVRSFVGRAQEEGARLVTGGAPPPGFDSGYWWSPTIFADVTPDMYLARNEVFGPVLSVFRWRDIDEVIEIANGLEFGLSGSVWTRDLDTAITTARRIRSGYIWINGAGPHYPAVPFGGMKNSGLGREEAFDDMMSYTEEKAYSIVLQS